MQFFVGCARHFQHHMHWGPFFGMEKIKINMPKLKEKQNKKITSKFFRSKKGKYYFVLGNKRRAKCLQVVSRTIGHFIPVFVFLLPFSSLCSSCMQISWNVALVFLVLQGLDVIFSTSSIGALFFWMENIKINMPKL